VRLGDGLFNGRLGDGLRSRSRHLDLLLCDGLRLSFAAAEGLFELALDCGAGLLDTYAQVLALDDALLLT